MQTIQPLLIAIGSMCLVGTSTTEYSPKVTNDNPSLVVEKTSVIVPVANESTNLNTTTDVWQLVDLPSQVKEFQPPDQDRVFPRETVAAQTGVVLDIEAALPYGVPYAWTIPKQPGMEFRSAGSLGFVFPTRPGSYWVGVAYGNPIKAAWLTVIVTNEPVQPSIPDIPKPPLPPVPSPNTNSVTMVAVYDKIPPLPPFSSYVPLTDYMLSKGHRWRIIDKDGKDSRGIVAEQHKLLSSLQTTSLPYIAIFQKGQLRLTLPMPKTGEDMLKSLQGSDR